MNGDRRRRDKKEDATKVGRGGVGRGGGGGGGGGGGHRRNHNLNIPDFLPANDLLFR